MNKLIRTIVASEPELPLKDEMRHALRYCQHVNRRIKAEHLENEQEVLDYLDELNKLSVEL